MSVQGTATALVKNIFYKTCFCIGLGTASYYSYGQVQNWVGDKPSAPAAQVTGTTLAEKVNTLFSSSPIITTVQSVLANPHSALAANGAERANPKTILALSSASVAAPAAAALTAPADPNATPAASPSPGEASAEKKEGDTKEADAKKDGEKKEGTEEATEAPKVANVGPVNEVGLPYSPFAQPQPAAAAVAEQNQVAGTAAANAAAMAANAGYSGGVASTGSLYNSGSGSTLTTTGETSGATTSTSSSSSGGSYTTGTTTTYTGVTSTTGTFLTASDLALLITPIKASFPDQSENVAGMVCILGNAPGQVQDCVRNNQYAVHTNRWNLNYGLETDASFVIRSTSGSSQVSVAMDFKLQDSNQNLKDMAFQANPTEISVHTESRNSKLYKVYEMKMPDLTANGDKLTSVLATLVYEEPTTATGVAVMTSDSNVTFVRTHIQTLSSVWDFTGTNRAPAANEQVITADSVSYSMSLQKSP